MTKFTAKMQKIVTVDCIIALEHIVYNTGHHFIVTLSPICQPLIRAQLDRWQSLQGVHNNIMLFLLYAFYAPDDHCYCHDVQPIKLCIKSDLFPHKIAIVQTTLAGS